MIALSVRLSLGVSIGLITLPAFSSSLQEPECLSGGSVLEVNNQEIIQWKTNTQNQYRDRAHIQGTILGVYSDQGRHHHYKVALGSGANETIEVIYNEDFGGVPAVHVGSTIEACGDYVTSYAPCGRYPASPDGAILHWVHRSPNPSRHDSGFLILDGEVCGQGAERF